MNGLDVMESVRRVANILLPMNIYRMASHFLNSFYAIKKMGWNNYRILFGAMRKDSIKDPFFKVCRLDIPNLFHPFYVRSGTSDPTGVLHSIIREAYGKYLPSNPVKLIVDAGANIGDTTVWYLSNFPKAKVVAIEPDPDNFMMLKRNCSPYGKRAILLHAGLWPKKGKLHVLGEQYYKSNIKIVEVPEDHPYTCEAISLQEIFDKTAADTIDIFKCDIEGAELELFSNSSESWLDRIKSMFIEIHSQEAKSLIMEATSRHLFDCRVYWDLHIFNKV